MATKKSPKVVKPLRVDAKKWAKLEKIAERKQRYVSELARIIIEKYVDEFDLEA